MKLYEVEYQDIYGVKDQMIVMAEDISTADHITKSEAGKKVRVLSIKESAARAIINEQ